MSPDPGDYRYDPPTDSPFNDIDQYVPILLAAVEDWLDYPDVWPEGEEVDAQGYMEDLKVWIQELSQTMLTPIGTIVPYIGTNAPDGWLKCNGTEYNQADYPALTAVLPAALKSGSVFYTPDMQGRMPVGVDTPNALFPLAETGGETEHGLSIDELPSHTHVQNAHTHVQDSHNHTQNAHTHVQDSHNHTQNSHNHTQDVHTHTQNSHNHTQDVHTHTQNSHNHTQDAHTHTQNAHQHGFNQRGSSVIGSALAMGSNGTGSLYSVNTDNATAVNQNATATNQAATATNQNATATNQAATATNQNATATNQAATATNNVTTATNQNATPTNNVTTATNQNTTAVNQSTGSNLAHNNMPPYFAVNYLIRAK